MKIGGLIGGVENGKFLDARTTAAKLADEQNYTLYLPNGKTEALNLKKPTAAQDICEDFYSFENIDPENRFEKGGIGLGEGFRWNPYRRVSKPIDLNNAEYKKIVNDFLRTKRIRQPVSKLEQAFRIDLDGDGREEVILTASRIIPYNSQRVIKSYDAFSIILIRRIVNGKPQTTMLEGEFQPKLTVDYDGYRHSVSSIADLNGDGRMEIVLYSAYYEGSNVSVVEMVGNKFEPVQNLSAGCGL
jgi:hypothetical protein